MSFRIGRLVRISPTSKVYEVTSVTKHPSGRTWVRLGRADHLHEEGSSRAASQIYLASDLIRETNLKLIKCDDNEQDEDCSELKEGNQ